MLWRDVVELITVTMSQNELGDDIEEPLYKSVFTNKKSIRQSEFYQAMNTGLKPELMFEIRSSDYNNEESLRYPTGEDGREYTIIRSYTKNDEITELVCQGLNNNAYA